MKRYVSLYYQFIKLSFLELSAHRANFYNSMASHLLWAMFTFVSMFLLTSKTKTVVGWSRNELFLLTAVFNILIGIFRMMVSKNMARFVRIIHFGQFDQYLLKPIDAQFWMSFRYVNLGALIRIPVAIVAAIFFASILGLSVSILKVILFAVLLFFGMLILYSVWLMLMTLIIWFTNLMNLEEFLNVTSGVTRFPKDIFENTFVFFFIILFPLTLVVSVPTKFLLNRASVFEIVALVTAAVVLFTCSRLFWKHALRFYTSAGG